MPTLAEFEAAAEMFSHAAGQVASLASEIGRAGAADILYGGSLGTQVPNRIAVASSTALSCRTSIERAEQVCRDRAAIIAEYEAQLAVYDIARQRYDKAHATWQSRYRRWWGNPGRWAHPGARPIPPTPPSPPPAWATVRRP